MLHVIVKISSVVMDSEQSTWWHPRISLPLKDSRRHNIYVPSLKKKFRNQNKIIVNGEVTLSKSGFKENYQALINTLFYL